MSYEVLARKWRPQTFQDVIGQEHIAQTLINAIKSDRLAHAYLFSGPRGIGKTSVARILGKAINCEQGEPGIPCNTCRSCVGITEGSSVDVQEIDGASNRGIEDIRELRDNIHYSPTLGKYRVYIIDEVHMLTIHAFNALLKTLEEPPAHVKFIFATTETHKVPVTILSRCQRFDFKRIPLKKMISHLENITRKEGIEITQSGLSIIAREADGGMRDAQSLLDQVISFTGMNVEDKQIVEILGIIDREIIFNISRAIIENSPQKCLEIIEEIYNYGYDLKEFYSALMEQFRNLTITHLAPDNEMLILNESEKEEAISQAGEAGGEKLQMILNYLIVKEPDLRFTSHPRLVLEATLIKLCRIGDVFSFEEILTKIQNLEKKLVEPSSDREPKSLGRVFDPGVEWTSEKSDSSYESEPIPSGREKTWDDFLRYLLKKSKSMYSNLKSWKFVKQSDKIIEISPPIQPFSAAYLNDVEKYEELVKYCRDFYKRDIHIKTVTENKSFNEAVLPGISEKPEYRPNTFESDHKIPPIAEDIRRMFQGEIEKK